MPKKILTDVPLCGEEYPNAITVGELIERLSKYPKDMKIIRETDGGYCGVTDIVELIVGRYDIRERRGRKNGMS